MIETIVTARGTSVFVAQVNAGETWTFQARGTWTDWFIKTGPAGYYSKIAALFGFWPRLAGARLFELIGMIEGQPGSMFGIGTGVTHKFTHAGRLLVFANDVDGLYWNNRGAVHLASQRDALALGDPAGAHPPLPPHHKQGPSAIQDGDRLTQLAWWWNLLLDTHARTHGFLYILGLTLLISAALAGLDQGRDLIASVIETPAGAAWLTATVAFLAFQAWFWTRRIIEVNYGFNRRHWGEARGLLVWAPRVVGIIPFAIMAGTAAWASLTGMREKGLSYDGGPTLVAMLVGLGLYAAFVFFRTKISQRLTASRRHGNWFAPFMTLTGWVWPVGTLLASFIALVWVVGWPTVTLPGAGAPAVVFFAAACTLPVMVVLLQLGQMTRIPVLACLVGWALFCSLFNDGQHAVGRRSYSQAKTDQAAPPAGAETVFAAWLKGIHGPTDENSKIPLFVVAAEGGASRAGYWTAVALDQLQRQSGQAFSKNTFAISSISGGSVGAVGWAASLDPTHPDSASATLLDFAGHDALAPTIAEATFPDLLQRFIPFPALPDRAEGIERAWETGWKEACRRHDCVDINAKPLPIAKPRIEPDVIADLYSNLWKDSLAPAAQLWRPLVFVGGAIAEDGRRISTGPITLPKGVDSYDFRKEFGQDVRVSTAIHNGARFPWVSPAGRLPMNQRGGEAHVIDGGYYDASAIATGQELLEAMKIMACPPQLTTLDGATLASTAPPKTTTVAVSSKPAAAALERAPKACGYSFHLVTIRYCDAGAFCPPAGEGLVDNTSQAAPPLKAKSFAADVLGPVRGLMSGRDGHQAHLIKNAGQDPDIQIHDILLRGKTCEGMPLNWVLSRTVTDYMQASAVGSIRDNQKLKVASEPQWSTAKDIAKVAKLFPGYIPPNNKVPTFNCKGSRA